jgi:alpha-methylacyl-CoA racemase
MDEAPQHPHNRERGAFVELDGVAQPAPAPRFSRTRLDPPTAPEHPGGSDPRAVLMEWGIPAAEAEAAYTDGVLV